MEKEIDARGLACPKPVILTKKELDNIEQTTPAKVAEPALTAVAIVVSVVLPPFGAIIAKFPSCFLSISYKSTYEPAYGASLRAVAPKPEKYPLKPLAFQISLVAAHRDE